MNHPPEFIVTKWSDCLNKTSEWYATDEATRIADNVLLYQRPNGGWPKNIAMAAVLTELEKQDLAKNKNLTDTTIDNGASFTQLVYLARVTTAKSIERHRAAFERGSIGRVRKFPRGTSTRPPPRRLQTSIAL